MTFAVVIIEATAISTMEMMMKALAMCGTEMMRKLPTTMLVVIRSKVLSRDKKTTFLKSPRR
jgi:hypothetical protein